MTITSRCKPSALVVLAFALGACASVPVPETELATARTALEQAQNAGAPQQAPASFALAREKLNRAEAAVQQGDNVHAKRLAEQARLDAQLAQVQARSGASQRAVSELEESMRALREEMNRKP